MQGFQSISQSLLTQQPPVVLCFSHSPVFINTISKLQWVVNGLPEVNMSFSHDMDVEYKKLIQMVNPPRVIIDNKTCKMQR
ncbi:hypothetical protein COP2_047824 [Malus domestica]